MPFLTYDGTAQDHEDTPEKHEIRTDKDGEEELVLVSKHKRTFMAAEVKKIWGMEFPKGEAVDVAKVVKNAAKKGQRLTEAYIVKKATALGCFKVDDKAPKAEPKV